MGPILPIIIKYTIEKYTWYQVPDTSTRDRKQADFHLPVSDQQESAGMYYMCKGNNSRLWPMQNEGKVEVWGIVTTV